MVKDVPSPIDFHDAAQARAWVEDTVLRRPARPNFFAAFAGMLNSAFDRPFDVLELGSGPGHLAEWILRDCAVRRYVALDFSAAMHDIARECLTPYLSQVEFVQRDFRVRDWGKDMGSFDAVVTMQAAHETRHTSYLPQFLSAARQCLSPQGMLLYCDHYFEEGKNPKLMISRDAQLDALTGAGFSRVERIWDEGGMALYCSRNDWAGSE